MHINYEALAEKASSIFYMDERGTRGQAQECKYILSFGSITFVNIPLAK